MMAQMTKLAAAALREADPKAQIVSASVTGDFGLKWFDEYLSEGAGAVVDVIGYHLYVTPKPPEDMLSLAISIREKIAAHGLGSKPLWNTESGWAKPKSFTPDEAAAYLARAFILNWAGGVKRFYWYAWDNYWWVTLFMTDSATRRPLPAAFAYSTVETWLTGATLRDCKSSLAGIWSCRVERQSGSAWLLWRPEGDYAFQLPDSMKKSKWISSLNGDQGLITGDVALIGPSPKLLSLHQNVGKNARATFPVKY